MSTKRYTVTCHWDQEAQVWFVAETDVPGLATEAATVEEMESKLLRMVPELIALNEAPAASQPVPFELITRLPGHVGAYNQHPPGARSSVG